MKIGFKYKHCPGFGRMYNYGLKHFNPNIMITDKAETRLKILNYWKKYGSEATHDAFGAKRSTLYYWQKLYKDSGYKIESLNPGIQARKDNHKREIHSLVLAEIKRLRLEVCPNMGKAKIKKYLDIFCRKNNLSIYSESKIGRIIKDKKIYHQRQKFYHNGQLKTVKRTKKLRKPKDFTAYEQGDLVEIDTIVKFVWNVKRYIITAVDVKTRYSFAWAYERATSVNARDFYQKLKIAFPYAIKATQTDNGSEFHKYFRDYLEKSRITHYWNYPGQPYKNGHIEKYNRTMQEEFVDQNEILLQDVNEFNQKLMDWLVWYNTERYHWSLDLTSPVDYLLKNSLVSNMCWTNT
ncbi:MAG: integrase core domain-containing protein, partial [Patescibacteria group bacterium]